VAIAKAIEAAIGKRQGQRTDKGLVQHFAQVPAGVKTREIAAEKAGFDNHETYRQARRVVERGVQELVEAMDKGHHTHRTPQGDLRGAASGGAAQKQREAKPERICKASRNGFAWLFCRHGC
jgi:hypothetical protein